MTEILFKELSFTNLKLRLQGLVNRLEPLGVRLPPPTDLSNHKVCTVLAPLV